MKQLLTVALACGALALPASAFAEPTPSIHYGFDECTAGSSTTNLVSEEGDPLLYYVNEPLATVGGSSGAEGDCGLNFNFSTRWTRADTRTRLFYQTLTTGPNANSLTLSADVRLTTIGYAWQWLAGDDLCNETGEISDGSCIAYALYAAGPDGGAPRAYVKLAGEGTELLGVVGTSALTDYEWHNLTMTYTEGVLKLYVDGELDASARTTLPDRAPSVISGNRVLGVFNVGGQHINGNPGEPLGGDVDNVRFYKQALTVEEIEAIQP